MGQAEDPAFSPDGSKVVFTAVRNGQSDLYVINTDGTGLIQLTQDSRVENGAVWSPDSKRIAFHAQNPTSYIRDLYILGDTSLTPVTACLENAFDQDGDSIPEVTGCPLLHLSDSDPDASYNWYPSWSPDSTELAYCSNRDEGQGVRGSYDIYLRSADGSGNIRRLTDRSTPGIYLNPGDGFCYPGWSRVDNAIAVVFAWSWEQLYNAYFAVFSPQGSLLYSEISETLSFNIIVDPTAWSPEGIAYALAICGFNGIKIRWGTDTGTIGERTLRIHYSRSPDWGPVASGTPPSPTPTPTGTWYTETPTSTPTPTGTWSTETPTATPTGTWSRRSLFLH